MAGILIQKDPQNLVYKDVTAAQRLVWAQDFTIYDVNADGSKGAAYGPTVARSEEGAVTINSLDGLERGPDGAAVPWAAAAQALVSGAGNLASGTKFIGAAKGGLAVNVSSGLSAGVFSLGAKIAAEGEFVALRVVIINRAANALNNNRLIVGVTETAAIDTNANRESVVIGGVAYAQLAPANTVNGFFPVTFAGAATVSLSAATTAVQFAISDRIPLTSVPRADGGTLPLIQVRMDHDGSVDGNFCFFSTAAASAMRTATAANRGRIIQMYTGTALAATPANVGSIGTTAFEIFVIPDYTEPAMSVMGSGDSIVDGAGQVADLFSSWGLRACADASAAGRRATWMNMGGSSMDAINNWARCQEIINAGVVPDVLVIQPASVNDNSGAGWATTSNLPALVQKSKARAIEIQQYAKSKGIKRVIMVPLLPLNTQDATQSAARVSFNLWLSNLCAARSMGYLNFVGLGDGAAAERWVLNNCFEVAAGAFSTGKTYVIKTVGTTDFTVIGASANTVGTLFVASGAGSGTGTAIDGIHPNEAAIEAVLTPALAAQLRAIAV